MSAPTSLAIGVDIGGTKVAAGVVDGSGAIVDRERADTPGTDVAATERVIVEVVTALAARHDVTAVGIGAAGWIGNDHATVLFSPHLAWRDEPLRDALGGRIPLPVVVENDANAAAWAEYRFGAARDDAVVVCVTLGTGIGGGLVADGSVYRGAFGIACEYGHMTLVPDGRRCACGNRGCWEMYASGRALARDARELADESPMAAERMVALAGSVDALTGLHVTAAAAAGDPAARSICTTVGRWLGRGLANLAAVIDPSVFVIGGGVVAAGELLLGPAREEFEHTLTGRGFRPPARVVAAALGPDAGLVGAADLARRYARPAG
ncbi:glucokinase [Jatrophihabitans endophyticus]|uniref:Glucokinase n=1 Tax=Jatrophihabitans endophyticus TaxID=1206085 RepID=A0A1M5L430_9ACTN|nr:ROK family glucokinase [Jatrophihabitans endophyticus]SHG59746.1 glucokinase [Jatrophihabitans endophyticus]